MLLREFVHDYLGMCLCFGLGCCGRETRPKVQIKPSAIYRPSSAPGVNSCKCPPSLPRSRLVDHLGDLGADNVQDLTLFASPQDRFNFRAIVMGIRDGAMPLLRVVTVCGVGKGKAIADYMLICESGGIS